MNSPVEDRPRGRLVSLWDIMKPFNASAFLSAKGFLRNYQAFETMSKLTFIGISKDMTPKTVIDKRHRRIYSDAWSSMRRMVEELDLDASLASLDRMLKCLANKKTTFGDYWELAREFEGRLSDQMEARMFLSLSVSEAAGYYNSTDGWEEVLQAYPESLGDVEEARKCFALSRYPATVFHSLQVVEHGVIRLGKLIGVTDHQPGWTATTARLAAVLKQDYRTLTDAEKAMRPALEQVHALVHALQQAWRNKVSHAGVKLAVLTSDFTPDVAEEILFASRAFMRRLATDASLNPPAPPS